MLDCYIMQVKDKDFKHLGFLVINDDGTMKLTQEKSKAHVFTIMKQLATNSPKVREAFPNCYYYIHNLERARKSLNKINDKSIYERIKFNFKLPSIKSAKSIDSIEGEIQVVKER